MLAKTGMDKISDKERLRLLFLNVVAQAVKDAFLTRHVESSSIGTSKAVKRHALHWLTEDKSDFFTVCDWAGVSADRIRSKSIELAQMPENERRAEVKKLIVTERDLYRYKPEFTRKKQKNKNIFKGLDTKNWSYPQGKAL